jgi:putative transposase
MNITWRVPEDHAEIQRRVAEESNAKQRDRLRAVALAVGGQDAPRIAQMLGRSRRFVQQWAYIYRDHGLQAVRATPQTGQPKKLLSEQEALFKARMLAGVTPADEGLCTLRGKDAQRILRQEFGKHYTLGGAYALLHRLGLSCLMPRPRHRKNDPAAMDRWLQDAPFLSRKSAKAIRTARSKSGSKTKPASASRARSRVSGPHAAAGRRP